MKMERKASKWPGKSHPQAQYIIAWASGEHVQYRQDEYGVWADVTPDDAWVWEPNQDLEFRLEKYLF